MGLRGPAPFPTALHVANGNPSKRPLPELEPNYRTGVPDQPPGMTQAAQEYWDFFVEQMVPTGVLRIVDGPLLADLCEDKAALEEMRRGLQGQLADMERAAVERGETIPGNAAAMYATSNAGRRVQSAIRELKASVDRQMREFGLTPSSNSRVEARTPGRRMDGIAATMSARKQRPTG